MEIQPIITERLLILRLFELSPKASIRAAEIQKYLKTTLNIPHPYEDGYRIMD